MKTRNTIVRVGIITMALLCCMEASAQNNRRKVNQNRRSVPTKKTPQIKSDSLIQQRQQLEMREELDQRALKQPERAEVVIVNLNEATWQETPPPPPPPQMERVEVLNSIYDVVEQPPSFAHGNVMAWLCQNIHYPPLAEENGIQGRVIVSFVVEPDGSLSNIAVVKGVDPSLDKEAVRVVSAMPKWNPGTQNNVCVRVKYNLPITFKLEDPEPKEASTPQ